MRYVAPIKIGASEKVKTIIKENDPTNPATWDNDLLVDWICNYSKGRVDTEKFCPFESGK